MPDERLPCRCFGVRRDDGAGYTVVASAFLCPDGHNQGDVVTNEDVRRLEASRAEEQER